MSNDHNCLFQVSLFHNDRLLASSEWTSDKGAVIEAVDGINTDHRDIRAAIVDDIDQEQLVVVKSGHILLRFDHSDTVGSIFGVLNAAPPYHLRASVVTKASGHVQLPQTMRIGG
jgi:hypothetical protein